MIIEKANKKDIKDILKLQYLAYQSEAVLLNNPNIPPLTQTLENALVEFNKGVFLKAIINGKIIGSVRGYIKSDTLYIGKLMVNPDFQGRGVGTKLLKEIENLYPEMNYELFTSDRSEKNIRLYEKLGYVKFKSEVISNDLTLIYLRK